MLAQAATSSYSQSFCSIYLHVSIYSYCNILLGQAIALIITFKTWYKLIALHRLAKCDLVLLLYIVFSVVNIHLESNIVAFFQIIKYFFCMNLNKVGKKNNAGAQLDFPNYHICIKK
jgi:hypothetical protein